MQRCSRVNGSHDEAFRPDLLPPCLPWSRSTPPPREPTPASARRQHRGSPGAHGPAAGYANAMKATVDGGRTLSRFAPAPRGSCPPRESSRSVPRRHGAGPRHGPSRNLVGPRRLREGGRATSPAQAEKLVAARRTPTTRRASRRSSSRSAQACGACHGHTVQQRGAIQANLISAHTHPAAITTISMASSGLANLGCREFAGSRFLPVTIGRTRSCRLTAA